jgi:PAS domain S-box-containing protein
VSGPKDISSPASRQFQAVLDSVANAVCTIDRAFFITSFNRAAEELTGFSRAEVLGRHCYEVFRTPACRTDDGCPMTQSLHNGKVLPRREVSILNRGDRRVSVQACFTPLRDESGRLVGGVETFGRASLPRGGSRVSAGGSGLSLLEASERQTIEDVLRQHAWNRTAAAEVLGISRITLWRKMRKLGIQRCADA